MKTIKKLKILNRLDYFKKHLEIINPLLPINLTPREIEVLAAFISLEGDLEYDRFGTTGRKIVKEKLNISDGGLGNYLKSLKNKNFIYKEKGSWKIIQIVIPNNENQEYNFKLVNNG